MDYGFVVISEEEASLVNPNLLPEDYYLIRLKGT